jgi:hypothetical protein
MSEKPAISDEPLPDGELVADMPASAPVEHPGPHADLHEQLPAAHLDKPAGGYGHTDPASLAAGISLDLHDPDLIEADKDTLNQPTWTQSGTQATDGAAMTGDAPTSSSWSQMPPVLAHLAQVGLTSADQWEEQIQPRLQQLHEDIAQVHAQLDVLERRKPKK